ncbi:peptidase family C50-domain-containing protein [Collybia nuda]|uniref:separase n=1 Tax=Collybia nuda TaxID=64659 RepID=A0A9P5XUU6_9AGAR|nr:peptidase family C50-domain-containing protein [Collybia nuda]
MTTRRTVLTRHERSKKQPTNTVDKLVEQLSTKLAISDRELGRQMAFPDEEVRLSAMRSVNSASQELSAIIKSGWKRSSNTAALKQNLRDVTRLTALANEGLAELRRISPRDVDVERAAVSVLGKLVALEMFNESMSTLEDLHSRLCFLHNFPLQSSSPRNRLRLVSISLPSPGDGSLDSTLLTLTATYLAFALSVLSTTCFTSVPTAGDVSSIIEDFSTALENDPTLLTWLPSLFSVSGKQLDSILTRVYTALVRSCATCSHSPQAVFITRIYALRCLAHTTTGTIEPSHLWDQATRFGRALIKMQEASDDKTTRCVLSAYGDIVDIAEKRADRETFMSGQSFSRFSEYWLAFAKKAGNISALDRIGGVMRRSPLQLLSSHGVSSLVTQSTDNHDEDRIKGGQVQDTEHMVQEGYHLCAVLAQTTISLEQGGQNLVQKVQEMSDLLVESRPFVGSLKVYGTYKDEIKRIDEKLDRALERTQRAAVAFLEASRDTFADNDEISVRTLIEEILQIWLLPGGSSPSFDSITRSLETLFTLARIVLSPTDSKSHPSAYRYLAQAVTIVEASKLEVMIDAANLIRCISGAFHNIAGRLYQAGRHGAAIGFLQDACSLGMRALSMPRIATSNKMNEKTEEGWRQLGEQVYRRWELLGVCYSKIGDRKKAFEALCHCISSYPYAKSGFSEQIAKYPLTALFDESNSTKQLGILVDKLTYLAACELLMEAKLVSLTSLNFENSGIAGALLERQVESLEPHRRKEGVQVIIAGLLKDALGIYTEDMPIRRARVLLKCINFTYHAGPEALPDIGPPENIALEIEKLLEPEEFGKDDHLGRFRPQYQASVHLWLALHAHRRVDPEQNTLIKHHSDAACRILKGVVDTPSHKPAQKSSPKQSLSSKKTLGPPIPRLRSKKAALSKNVEPITPKPKPKKDQYSSLPRTPTRLPSLTEKAPLDDIESLLTLLHMTARISGLLALSISKVHILDITRKLCDRQMGSTSDGYIMTSIDLAHEYVKFGKVKRAAEIFNQILVPIRSGKVSEEACILYFLRFAELLALTEKADNSINAYCEALALSESIDVEGRTMSATQRVYIRVRRLERAAIASRVFSLIQYLKEDISTYLDGTLQSLRLWNRAVDSLTRLSFPPTAPSNLPTESNPFHVASEKPAARSPEAPLNEAFVSSKVFARWSCLSLQEWRIAEGLLETLFSLSHLYFSRGSPREADYFAQQARNLAESLNAPAMVSRALARIGEVQLHQGLLDRGSETLTKANEVLQNNLSFDNADICRLLGIYNERTLQRTNAMELYQETIDIIKTLDQTFNLFDGLAFGSLEKSTNDVALPEMLAVVLRQKIWLLRDHDIEAYTPFLNRFLSLPNSNRTKAEESALMAKLTLHAVHGRLHSDMFLYSMAESTIALPMGMTSKVEYIQPLPVHDILATLDKAAQLYRANLVLSAARGSVHEVRETITSLALVQAFQTSLGKTGTGGPYLVASLLDASAAITIRRDMLAIIRHKFPARVGDDLRWPLLEVKGPQHLAPQTQIQNLPSVDELRPEDTLLKEYWNSIRTRYQEHAVDVLSQSPSLMAGLPSNWTMININVTEDKSMLFIARQEGGKSHREPLIFCIPLKGRRDNGAEDEEENLSFKDAIEEFHNIVRLSDKGTQAAAYIKEDQEARAAWWKQRGELNTRMRELLENIEYCWLGAFKVYHIYFLVAFHTNFLQTILSPRPRLTPELISDLRSQFEKVFYRNLHVKDNKSKSRPEKHKKHASQTQNLAPSQVTFDDSLLECFSTLSPRCRDEELEDLVYFILDLYQFHGVPVAIAEVDVVQVVVDLRSVLEEHALRLSQKEQLGNELTDEEHMFLILDKNLQCLPWENIPILRGRSISRIPSIDFLHDRLILSKWKSQTTAQDHLSVDRAVIDPRKGYFILNPSGDLHRTEGRFKTWTTEMKDVGWEGIIGRAPTEQQFLHALQNQDLVVYFGHGGGEQYVRSHKIRALPSCAATMLWGCSSGALQDMGDFDRSGTPYSYMIAGCPTLVANLWDVTDRDIDLFSQAVFDKLHLTACGIRDWSSGQHKGSVSIVEAVAQSRNSCKLEYLTGAAPVVYGIPFYL